MPPGRRSTVQVGTVYGFGAHQRLRCSGWVKTSNISVCGAANSRSTMNSRSSVRELRECASNMRILVSVAGSLLSGLQFQEIIVQSVEAFFPEAAERLQPGLQLLEWFVP